MARGSSSSLRGIPAVEAVLREPALAEALAQMPRALVVEAVRSEVNAERERLKTSKNGPPADAPTLAARAAVRASADARPALRRVFNATGIVLHTNLGRAPLADPAREAVAAIAAGYSSLEFDLETGARGGRGAGVERWLTRLTGAEASIAVNNGAAAVLLVLSALASGRKVAVSRGELVEIGGSFRVPEIMEKSGATLIEVGATNRTHLRDYERALGKHPDLAAILRVHRSNFRIEGFTTRPGMSELARLARKHRVPLIEDLGSGALVDLTPFGLEHEPTVGESLAAGADVVTFSGDKLLGGSQAGLVLGTRKWVDRVKKDPLARAFRMEKLSLAALEATLALYADPDRARQEIPVLAMLGIGADVLRERAERLATFLRERAPGVTTRIVDGHGEVGGGSLPMQRLNGPVVEVRHASLDAAALERRARAADPPVIGIVRAGGFRLDPRTLAESEIEPAARSLAAVWGDALNR
jgi:L-seryl-tRNA(Ser) seleniumtransferase